MRGMMRLAIMGVPGAQGGGTPVLDRMLAQSNIVAVWSLNDTVSADESALPLTLSAAGVTLNGAPLVDSTRSAEFDGTGYIDILSPAFEAAFDGQEFTILHSVYIDMSLSALARSLTIFGDSDNFVEFRRTAEATLMYRYKAGGITITRELKNLYGHRRFDIGLTVSKSNDRMIIYLDGQPIGVSSTGLGAWDAEGLSANLCLLGARLISGDQGMVGRISHVAVYSAALTPEQIAAIYNVADVPNPNAYVTTNAASALAIDTYDGSDEVVHPDVLDMGDGNDFGGYRYIMGVTPYPASQGAYENPSIYGSQDGNAWEVPDGLTNPIDPNPGGGAGNSDPDLILSADGTTLWCVYREFNSPDVWIRARSSADLVTWSDEITLLHDDSGDVEVTLSPALVRWNNQYLMFTVDASGDSEAYPHRILRRTAGDVPGPWSEPTEVSIQIPYLLQGLYWWHIDVINDDGVLWMLAHARKDRLFLASSRDGGRTWSCAFDPVLVAGAAGQWDEKFIYRGTIVKTPAGFDCWYSAASGEYPYVWQIGRTSITQRDYTP